jgi:ABC-type nitrate/sulfonate/bicarbonate transport system substrate-binding protein
MTNNGQPRAAWLRATAGAAALSATALLARPARAQTATMRIGTSGNEANGDVFYAAEMGYFERAGLNVEVSVMANGAAVGAAIAGGSLDAGASSPFVFMNARRHGLPYTLIAPGALYQSTDATTVMVVAASSPVRNARELRGQTVGATTVGNLDHLSILAWLDQSGVDSSSVKVVEISPAAMTDALEQGRLFAALLPEPNLGAAGNRVRIIGKPYDAVAKTFMTSVWFTTNDFATKNPQSVRKFFDGMTQASAWAGNNRERAAVVLEKWTKVKVARIRMVSARRLDPALIQPICDQAFKYKMIDAPMDAREFIWSGRG